MPVNSPRSLDAALSHDIDLTGLKLIEASAGTGKTYTIANLYLRQVLAGRKPGDILVVSFTNAATDELHQRIQARLYQGLKTLNGAAEPADEFLELLRQRQLSADSGQQQLNLRRLQFALRSMDEAMISTIHGFCHAALQDHALLSNRQFESELISDDADYWDHALKDWWRCNTYSLERGSWALLNRAIPGLNQLQLWQRELRRHPQDRLIPKIDTPLDELLRRYANCDDGDEQLPLALRELKARALDEAHRFAIERVAAAKLAQRRLAYQDQLDLLLAALQQPAGERLAARLRTRFPVAMIDEFQDTDRVQLQIFEALYFAQPDVSLTLIGDPKQAIYGFRGGDIFTYIEARATPGLEIYALDTNWRSQARLVNAVNHLFSNRPEPFIYDHAIGFNPAIAAAQNTAGGLELDGRQSAALTLWRLPLKDNGKTLNVGETRSLLNQAVVAEISRLLAPATRAVIDGRPLVGGDIAILVRNNEEGEALRASLQAAAIDCVAIGRSNVFDSDEARALLDMLQAIALPADEALLRRARASSLFALDYLALARELDDDITWQQWTDRIRELHRSWTEQGFITMFQQMLQSLELAGALAAQPAAERRLTNLAQLGELLQQRSRVIPGIDALLNWMRRQMDGAAGDEAELRLESDAELVKIVTIHKSKGLEYPLVFVPFLWRCRLATKSVSMLRFHDADYQAYVDLGSDEFERHGFTAEKERLAEDLRLLYVALTRARSGLYLAWGDAGDGRSKGQPMHSALGYLLHSTQSACELETSLPRAFDDSLQMWTQIETFAASCEDIALRELPRAGGTAAAAPAPPPRPALQARSFSRELGPAWRVNSFTSLTRDVHQAALAGETRSQGDAILDFPAGSHIGLMLHELLELLEFDHPIEPQAALLVAQRAPRYGITGADHQRSLIDWLQQIVTTDLDAGGLRLDRLSNRQRLNELKFDLALDYFDVDAVNALLQQHSELPLTPITAARFRGLLTGIIDLVFEFEGRYYLADYKSNFLGARLDDYRPAQLLRAMFERRYDLQALLYSLALHRYLRQRLEDYDYERHFGGCYYLFLRAMRPSGGARHGVHFERAGSEQLAALERLLAYSPAAAS